MCMVTLIFFSIFKLILFFISLDIVALDTEYHDPEEFLSLSPPVDFANVSQGNSSSAGSSRLFPAAEQDSGNSSYVNHDVIMRATSDGVPDCPVTAGDVVPVEVAPPIPTKKSKAQTMGGQFVMPGISGSKPLGGKGGPLVPIVVPLPSSSGFLSEEAEEYTDGNELSAELLALNEAEKRASGASSSSFPARPRSDGAALFPASSSSAPPIAIKPKVLVNVGGNPPLPAHKPVLPRKPESPPIRTSPLVWQSRLDGNDFYPSSSSPAQHKAKVVPSAPPLPPEEVSIHQLLFCPLSICHVTQEKLSVLVDSYKVCSLIFCRMNKHNDLCCRDGVQPVVQLTSRGLIFFDVN